MHFPPIFACFCCIRCTVQDEEQRAKQQEHVERFRRPVHDAWVTKTDCILCLPHHGLHRRMSLPRTSSLQLRLVDPLLAMQCALARLSDRWRCFAPTWLEIDESMLATPGRKSWEQGRSSSHRVPHPATLEENPRTFCR